MERSAEAYRIERALANKLRSATRHARPRVAREVYADLYRLVHWHPDLTRSPIERDQLVTALTYAYERWICNARAVLEVGSGSCDLLRYLGHKYPRTVFAAIDVALDPLAKAGVKLPPNVLFVQAGASEIPFADDSFDFVFCSQVLEHFHADDASDHVAEVARVLEPGGWFGFDTPNRITGPHDISRGFSLEATGLHLKEWTFQELEVLLREKGFDTVLTLGMPGRVARRLGLKPPGPLMAARRKSVVERWVAKVSAIGLRRAVGRVLGVSGIYLYARKRTR
jgi:SAM-dependent methyltransferase